MTAPSIPRLILASASPRRRSLLVELGLNPTILPVRVSERRRDGEAPDALAGRLAGEKARAAVARPAAAGGVVLAADTVVALGDRCLGKPDSIAEARRMLRELSGREHRVLTGVHVARTDGGDREAGLVRTTRVFFQELSPAWIDWYVASGESMDKAGAYGIQERAALLVDRIEGSWSNVVGLPLEVLPGLFREVGIDLIRYWGRETR